jgi:hypothetical protein
MRAQQEVTAALLRGEVDLALGLAEGLAPGALKSHPRTDFKLRCQKLCEMVSVWYSVFSLVFRVFLHKSNLRTVRGLTTTPPTASRTQIGARQDETAMAFAREAFSGVQQPSSPEERELLEDCLSLFAYEGG